MKYLESDRVVDNAKKVNSSYMFYCTNLLVQEEKFLNGEILRWVEDVRN